MIASNLHFYELMYVFGGIIRMMKSSIQKTIQHGTEILWLFSASKHFVFW